MKEIKNFNSQKYDDTKKYKYIKEGIYQTIGESNKEVYVTSLSFVQEPELGEGMNAANISQYPLEDILDNFRCYISDFYNDLNKESSDICYLEFASSNIQCINGVVSLIGKHVYNKKDENGLIHLMTDNETVIPLVTDINNKKKNNILGYIMIISVLGSLIFAIAAGATKNKTFMLIFALCFVAVIISSIAIKK